MKTTQTIKSEVETILALFATDPSEKNREMAKNHFIEIATMAEKWKAHEKELRNKELEGVTEENFIRLPSDSNGNPRYYLPLYLADFKIARHLGATVYRGKQYGAGWVFQTYSVRSEAKAINDFNAAKTVEKV